MKKEVRIIIAGGRDFCDYKLLVNSVNDILFDLERRNTETGIGNGSRESEKHKIKFISGTARGADKLGEMFAAQRGYRVIRMPANWDMYGKGAGFVRNEQMAIYASGDDEGRESYGVLIAFWDGKSRGTKHMIDTATKYGLEVHVINYNKDVEE